MFLGISIFVFCKRKISRGFGAISRGFGGISRGFGGISRGFEKYAILRKFSQILEKVLSFGVFFC